MNVVTRLLIALSLALGLTACSDELPIPTPGGSTTDGTPLRIVAATELQDLQPVIEEAADDLGFPIELSFPAGTLDNSRTLLEGGFDGEYDATWFATNRYVDILGATGKLRDQTKIGLSPVAFGVDSTKASELGWDDRQPTWSEIATAAADGDVTFGMTDPSASNSGFSALVSVATALADTGSALTEADIERITPQLQGFFSGQTLTSGSSGWLTDTFLEDRSRADALINYESVLHTQVSEGADLEVIVPADGVVSADYPLSTLASPAQPEAREKVAALSEWLLERPEIMTDSYRRPVDATDLPPELADQLLIELPFPATRAITDQLVAAFHNELRPPGDTAFVLDTSGSMEGERLSMLQETMLSLIDGTAQGAAGGVGLRDRERVSLQPFADVPAEPLTLRFSTSDPGPAQELTAAVEGLRAEGATSLYSALMSAFDTVAAADGAIPSIVLMSDGEVTSGATLAQFRAFHDSLDAPQSDIPVFVILYGEANVAEMRAVAEMTGGHVFDALDGDLEAAFKEIRGYQ
ncbi:MAG: VWA domain-containing protein [Corynebacterium sp.]|uniref:vWA domain-containing protein n=1 Tax=Corynebacterium sp. TaxID=1720 RepID=UPI0026DEA311|nr:VWA domain-containing protein [Corynebacterium sp.]MDO5668914.1 VWA domain-containing protein [Corynebacterium sp.]